MSVLGLISNTLQLLSVELFYVLMSGFKAEEIFYVLQSLDYSKEFWNGNVDSISKCKQ